MKVICTKKCYFKSRIWNVGEELDVDKCPKHFRPASFEKPKVPVKAPKK